MINTSASLSQFTSIGAGFGRTQSLRPGLISSLGIMQGIDCGGYKLRKGLRKQPPNFNWVTSTLDMVRHYARAEMDDETILEISRQFAPPYGWSDRHEALVKAAIPIARQEHSERAQYRAARRAEDNEQANH